MAAPHTAGRNALTLSLQNESRGFETRPGSVVLITAQGSHALVTVDGSAFKHAISFWPMRDGGSWQALVAVPLSAPPGSHAILARAKDGNGAEATEKLSLTVRPAHFETRRLTVDARYVNPPPEEAERIAREARTLAEIFAQSHERRLWREPFATPVQGAATSSFGRLTILNGVKRGRHLGTDFRAAEGTPVSAPNAGRVVLCDNYYFSGKTVILDHGDALYSLLGHLSRIAVTPGIIVQRGDPIGESGATGRVTGPHLHWAVRLQNESVDPRTLLDASKLAHE
jgi:murein DD-endopeptidase MepM/ murein hydrolase activator NlpD